EDRGVLGLQRGGQLTGHFSASRCVARAAAIERARAVKADFGVGADDAAAIAEIVRRLDGLPLAIELAAAKVRVLTPRALLDRLASRLGTLTGGARDLPARQRTLRDAIAWSYQLLPPHEQELFARLGVFAGAFDLTAARAVAGVPDQYAGLDALASLIESSLITQEPGEREPRFTMLGIIREFALERLRDAGDWKDTHDRHAQHYLAFAERTAPPLGRTSANPRAVDDLESEHDNLRAAMNWFIDTEQLEEAVRLGWIVWVLWWLRGHTDEGARNVKRVLERADSLSPQAYAHVLFGDGSIAFITGQHARGRTQLEKALPLLREVGDEDATARAAGMLGQLALARGDYDLARELLEETKQISERLGEDWMIALYYARLGLVPLNEGDYAAAVDQFADGLRIARKTNDHLGEVVALYSLAVATVAGGDLETSTRYLESGLRVSAAARDEAGVALYLEALSDLAARQGVAERAVRLAAAARKLQTVTSAAWMRAYVPAWPNGHRDLDTRAHPRAWAEGTADNLASAVAYALEPPR
ncbi:tetratricopeptide repeat protein, partial [Asanoa sp. NPDC050611]|uniref:ATP-binding protein n=1 Tax=Asanoa sp. NPDC050611 TaxID=3157098 RepID=UPI0033DAF461